ncbi:extracellular solute-binding protein [Helcococcus kunzii]|uniref:extracellular solute-binding protein n=1 Tax=Helcococcus kunzii TaxID=40091 RepID=UPI001C97CBEF|nr:extracellular solute-binding protein [Helcococcus kunzii]QZO75650.1 extracellular solute-binding protein [Helcococcus kunzii]
MKKLISLLLALVMVFSLVACGNTNTDTKGESTKESVDESKDQSKDESKDEGKEGAANGEKVEIKYLILSAGDGKDAVEKAINDRLNALGKNYTVKLLLMGWDNLNERVGLSARGAAGPEDTFDLATTASWIGPYQTLVDEDTLLELDPILEEAAPKLAESLTEEQKAAVTIDGHMYGIPTVIDKAIIARDHLLWNVNELAEIGMKPEDVENIRDIEGLEPILKKYKEKFPDSYPLFGKHWGNRRNNFIETAKDGSYVVQNPYESAEYKKAGELAQKYRDAGYMHPRIDEEGSDDIHKQEKWLVRRDEGEPSAEETWTNQYEMPIKAYTFEKDNVILNGIVQGKLTSIYKHTKHPKEALNFIELVRFDKEIQNILSYGIEGVNYDIKDGKVVAKEKVADKDKWEPWQNQFSNDLRIPTDKGTALDDPAMKERIEKHNSELYGSADLGFTPSKELREEMNAAQADLTQVTDIERGRFNENYDSLVQTLKDRNIDEIVQKLKTEFDAWYKEHHKN